MDRSFSHFCQKYQTQAQSRCFFIRGRTEVEGATKENIDDILKHHHDAQEKIAEEVIRMAQSMKHTSIVASNIIKTDTEVFLSLRHENESYFSNIYFFANLFVNLGIPSLPQIF